MKRRPLVAVGAALFLILALTTGSLAMATKTVTVNVDGRAITLRTRLKTVGEAVAKGGVTINPGDKVSPGLAEKLSKKTSVVITRAFPVTIKFDGKTLDVLTTLTTASDILVESGVTVGENDRLRLTKDKTEVKPEAVVGGTTIEVVRRETKMVTEDRKIPAETVYRDDAELPVGLTKVFQDGKDGLARVSLEVITENGRRVSAKELSREVIREPVMRVVLRGTSVTVTRGGRDIQFKKAFQMIATAYYPGPDSTGPGATGYTYTGMKATYGVVAVDPKVIPLHSLLYIDGYGYAIAGDIGSAIKGNKIDLCYDTKQEALDWGKRSVTVFLIK